ncbi:MAG: SRPBCC family protein [Dehalococcoidia bacterium]|nr:SRPBCC family protein [Dehalococcoidia bacterium]
MARIREGTHLKVTPDRVWPFIIDPEKSILWRKDTRTLTMPRGEDLQVGAHYSIEKEIGTRSYTLECTVTELEENRKFAFTGEAPGFVRVHVSYEVIPREKGCLFIIAERIDLLKMNFLKSFFSGLFIKKILANLVKCFLDNLKSTVEFQEGKPTATWHNALNHMW